MQMAEDSRYQVHDPTDVRKIFDQSKASQQVMEERISAVLKRLQDRFSDLEQQNQLLVSREWADGLNQPALRDALVGPVTPTKQEWVPDMLGTSGFGPWESDEFDDFLTSRGLILRVFPHEGLNAVILGRENWTEASLSKQIYLWNESAARVYTQELFVLGLVIGADPLATLTEQQLLAIAGQHPAISYLLAQQFPWPIQQESPTGQAGVQTWSEDEEFHQVSPLGMLGYSVAKDKWTTAQRRSILRKALHSEALPGLETSDAVKRWGAAYSAQRLYAISRHLFWLVSFQGPEKPAAREKWVSDLTWLKQSFYKRSQGFKWPLVFDQVPVALPKIASGLQRAVQPSPVLAEIVGTGKMSRQEVTKKVWEYIRLHNLQDHVDRRMIRPDKRLACVLGPNRMSMFEMTKVINDHLK
jgi:hypothetical protein